MVVPVLALWLDNFLSFSFLLPTSAGYKLAFGGYVIATAATTTRLGSVRKERMYDVR